MFIKWRTYQRQRYNQKGDKYFMQPILVQSYRASKKQFKVWAKSEGMPDQEFEERWNQIKESLNMPRHKQIYRFLGFPSCAYVYYDNPMWIEERKVYWEYLEITLEKGDLSDFPDEIKQRIKDEIETVLPKPYGYLLNILEQAYLDGKLKTRQSLKELYGTELKM